MVLDKRIGFMGAGQMAEALARGLIDRGVVQASQICCSDPSKARKELFQGFGATAHETNLEVSSIKASSVLLVAMLWTATGRLRLRTARHV